jgi:hypothetical protein
MSLTNILSMLNKIVLGMQFGMAKKIVEIMRARVGIGWSWLHTQTMLFMPNVFAYHK